MLGQLVAFGSRLLGYRNQIGSSIEFSETSVGPLVSFRTSSPSCAVLFNTSRYDEGKFITLAIRNSVTDFID